MKITNNNNKTNTKNGENKKLRQKKRSKNNKKIGKKQKRKQENGVKINNEQKIVKNKNKEITAVKIPQKLQ